MKRSIKTLGLMALLMCVLVQGAVLPLRAPMQSTALQMPAQMDMAACAHHSSTQHTTGQHCPHSQCCKGASCGCTQLPALMAPLPSLVAAAPVTGSSSIRAQLSLASVPAKFLRPPI